MKVRVAVAVPGACGLKVTENGTLCPSAMVTGKEIAATVNAALSELAAVTVTDPPLAVRVPDALPLLPTTTFPMLRVDGVAVSRPVVVMVVPLPVTDSVDVDG